MLRLREPFQDMSETALREALAILLQARPTAPLFARLRLLSAHSLIYHSPSSRPLLIISASSSSSGCR